MYDKAEGQRIAVERGWTIAPDGPYFRRVVPSPDPREIVELKTIQFLVDAGVIVICTGGGGIPVVTDEGGTLRGVEAVIDKDLASALLAERLDANILLMLTDVDAVCENWGTPQARPLQTTTAAELRTRTFAAGSMAPKIEAACRFVEATGHPAAIGSLSDARAILRGKSGTRITLN